MSSSLITDKVLPKELKLSILLENVDLVGGIFHMGYQDCSILTNDIWKQRAGGVPQHCFLLATAMDPGSIPKNEDDEEILLLRVIGPTKLPFEEELINMRSEAMREMLESIGNSSIEDPSDVLDILTKNEIQFSGIKAKILGTFYEKIVGKERILKFGSDIDNFYAISKYKIYKPYGNSLSKIASYPMITEEEEIMRQDRKKNNLEEKLIPRIKIGTVRYSSTDRRADKLEPKKPINVPVKVNIEDFISMKTALFGMTRMGKSNTMKIIATAIFKYSIENNIKIGQLLFDPTGEYANPNKQDNTALAQIGTDYVSIYKLNADEKKGEKALRLNFFDYKLIEVVWDLITSFVRIESSSGYMKEFIEAEVIGPEKMDIDFSQYNRAERRRAALYAILIKADFPIPNNFKIYVATNQKVLEAVNDGLSNSDQFQSQTNGKVLLSKSNIIRYWDRIVKLVEDKSDVLFEETKPWIDSQLNAILKLYMKKGMQRGYAIVKPLRSFHSPSSQDDYLNKVLDDLLNGKIVIIDLSIGSESVLQNCSERIIRGILRHSSKKFRENQELDKIQIFIEEAHRLFNRSKFEMLHSKDPYVMLAKEAAKFKIGLIYATQEVTSVDSQVLANTSNWIVTHLNNRKEIRELSKYYEFEDFQDQAIKSEDVGFARIKTRSNRFIIPTQIDLFSNELIKNTREVIINMKEESGD
ncbi:MAG: ATP-binding protein [Candidatus Hermodarchaeota archaeon]